jgi:Concanavalin A-like lectin/glucanases superfamily
MKELQQKLSMVILLIAALAFVGCQDLGGPEMGEYPVDENPPGGPLKFYVPFDGTSSNSLRNAVDQIKANFPQNNTTEITTGVTGNAMQGSSLKYVNYAKPNDWISNSESFTVAFWFKLNGQTKNNNGGNGPEYIFSIPSSNGHWSGGQGMLFFETNSTGTQIKFPVVDATMGDTWFTWEGNNAITGIADNTWRHCALVYDATTSKMTLYINGVANSLQPSWSNHGDINMNNGTASSFRIGAGPKTVNNDTADDWLRSTWKGGLDQFRLYNIALTASEVQDLYTNNK